ncbi:MAG: alpha/beta hydrolase, partial [Polyangiaceae bacterium]
VLAEYRGYALATASGPPSEEGLYRDASAVLDELGRQGIGPSRVVLMGISLGTGVAAEMARRGRGTVLILVSPFTSISEMARRTVPFLPAGWLCPDRYDTLSKAPSIVIPTLVVHGDEDEVVPFAIGRGVSEAIHGAKLHVVHGGHHNDLFAGDAHGLVALVAATASE